MKERRTASQPLYSLRLRLPLLITALIVVVLGTFLWTAYREVRANLLKSATGRAVVASDQLATVLTQSTQQRLTEIGRVAATAAVRKAIVTSDQETRDAAWRALVAMPSQVAQSSALWSAAGELLVSVTTQVGAAVAFPPTSRPSAAGVSELTLYGGVVFTEAIVEVPADVPPAADRTVARAPLGFLVVRRPIVASPTGGLLNRLVGNGASVKVGNRAGGVWTDLSQAVGAPPIDLSKSGVMTYEAADHVRRLGALTPIRGTPWMVWVEFPETTLLAPAHLWFRQMLLVALAFALCIALLVSLLTSRITTPLSELTQASEAIAGGEYSRRVLTARRDEIGRLGAAFNAMADKVEHVHAELEERVSARTARLAEQGMQLESRVQELKAARGELERHAAQLAAANHDLEAFSYSVSHDLRAPLRHVTGFAALLEQHAGAQMDETGRRYLQTMIDAASRMGRLIDDLLAFSRMGRAAVDRQRVSLETIVADARREVVSDAAEREIEWIVRPLPDVEGDAALLKLAFVNLLANAVKYTKGRARARIEVGANGHGGPGETVIFVRDNGVGFDMQYAHKLFGVFQRLHRTEDFDGTGIGLANVRRIVTRHGGRVWAEGEVDRGATFYVSLPTGGTLS